MQNIPNTLLASFGVTLQGHVAVTCWTLLPAVCQGSSNSHSTEQSLHTEQQLTFGHQEAQIPSVGSP